MASISDEESEATDQKSKQFLHAPSTSDANVEGSSVRHTSEETASAAQTSVDDRPIVKPKVIAGEDLEADLEKKIESVNNDLKTAARDITKLQQDIRQNSGCSSPIEAPSMPNSMATAVSSQVISETGRFEQPYIKVGRIGEEQNAAEHQILNASKCLHEAEKRTSAMQGKISHLQEKIYLLRKKYEKLSHHHLNTVERGSLLQSNLMLEKQLHSQTKEQLSAVKTELHKEKQRHRETQNRLSAKSRQVEKLCRDAEEKSEYQQQRIDDLTFVAEHQSSQISELSSAVRQASPPPETPEDCHALQRIIEQREIHIEELSQTVLDLQNAVEDLSQRRVFSDPRSL